MRELVFERYPVAVVADLNQDLPQQYPNITVDGDPVILHLLFGEVHSGFLTYSVEYRDQFLKCYVDESVYVSPDEQLGTQITGGIIYLCLRINNESNSINEQ